MSLEDWSSIAAYFTEIYSCNDPDNSDGMTKSRKRHSDPDATSLESEDAWKELERCMERTRLVAIQLTK